MGNIIDIAFGIVGGVILLGILLLIIVVVTAKVLVAYERWAIGKVMENDKPVDYDPVPDARPAPPADDYPGKVTPKPAPHLVGPIGEEAALKQLAEWLESQPPDMPVEAVFQYVRQNFPTFGVTAEFKDGSRIESPASRAPEVGHYLAACDCPDCTNSAAHGGIKLDAFVDDYGITSDGEDAIDATSPIGTCTCRHCREKRAAGFINMTAAQATTALEQWNKIRGYAL